MKSNEFFYSLSISLLVFFGIFLAMSQTLLTPLLTKASAQSQAIVVCPTNNVQHWDKIVFAITSSELAQRLRLPVNSELDIKVLDDPTRVADIKQKVLDFLKVPNEPRSSIDILQVRYAMVCVA